MVNTVRKNGQHRRIIFFIHIRHFQHAALRIDIAARKLRHFARNAAAVIRKARTGVQCFAAAFSSVRQFSGLMQKLFVPCGTISDSVTSAASLLNIITVPKSSALCAGRI